MKRPLLYVLTTLSSLIAVAACLAWLMGAWYSAHVIWTNGDVSYEVASGAGRFHIMRNAPARLRIRPSLFFMRGHLGSFSDWIGFRTEARSGFAGLEYAEGEHISAFSLVCEDTEFTKPEYKQQVQPGTMLRTTTRFRYWGIPHWMIAATAAIMPIAWQMAAWNRRRRETRRAPDNPTGSA